MESSTAIDSADHPADVIQRRIMEAFQLLSDLHADLNRPDVPAEAREHLAAATRELASIQRMFERRGSR